MPKISLLHPTIRPQKWYKACISWYTAADKPEDIEYVLVPEKNVFSDMEYPGFIVPHIFGYSIVGWNEKAATLVGGFNHAASLSRGDVLVVMADDVTPPLHWDTTILDLLGSKIKDDAVVWASSGIPDLDVGTIMHPILTRSYYDRKGLLFWPEYEDVYADTEFSDIAFKDGVVIDARDKLQITHERVGMDEVYKSHDDKGVRVRPFYLQRKAAGFPGQKP